MRPVWYKPHGQGHVSAQPSGRHRPTEGEKGLRVEGAMGPRLGVTAEAGTAWVELAPESAGTRVVSSLVWERPSWTEDSTSGQVSQETMLIC